MFLSFDDEDDTWMVFFWSFDDDDDKIWFLLIFWWRGWHMDGWLMVMKLFGEAVTATPEMLRGRSTSPWAGELGSFVLHLLIFHLVGFWWDDQWAPQAGEPGKICFGSHSLCFWTMGSGWHWQSDNLNTHFDSKVPQKTWTKQNRFLTPPPSPFLLIKCFIPPSACALHENSGVGLTLIEWP